MIRTENKPFNIKSNACKFSRVRSHWSQVISSFVRESMLSRTSVQHETKTRNKILSLNSKIFIETLSMVQRTFGNESVYSRTYTRRKPSSTRSMVIGWQRKKFEVIDSCSCQKIKNENNIDHFRFKGLDPLIVRTKQTG